MNDIIKEPLCYHCKNHAYHGYCIAFPDGIPEVILMGKDDHIKPYPGDNGIQFEPIDDEEIVAN